MRAPVLIVLEALLDGDYVEIGNETYALSESYELVAVRRDSNGKERYLKTFAELSGLIKLCESASEETLVTICANKALRMTMQSKQVITPGAAVSRLILELSQEEL